MKAFNLKNNVPANMAKPNIASLKGSAFTPPRWAPPKTTFSGYKMRRRTLGGPFNAAEVPTSLGIAAASVGAFWMGTKLPEPFKTLLMAGGVFGAGYSIYNLFSGPAETSAGVTETRTAPIPLPEAFGQVTAKFIKPRMYEQLSTGLFGFMPNLNWSDIDIEMLVSNPSDRKVSFTLRVDQIENSYRGNLSDQLTDAADYVYPDSLASRASYAMQVEVGANQSIPVKFQIDTQNWTGTLVERLIAYKIRSADEAPVKLTEVTFFT